MKYMMLSAVAVLGLLFADASANAQIIVNTPRVGVAVGVPGPAYYPYGYAPPVVYPAATVVTPGVSVGVGVGPVVGVGVGPVYRPYYGGYGYYRGPYYRHWR